MGGQKIYDYLTNQGYELSLGFVKSVLKSHGFVSKIVKTYKKKEKPHKSFDNKLNRQFDVSKEVHEQPRVVCDITEWPLQNGKKVYLCAALELATRAEELKWHVFHSFIQAERVVQEYIDGYYMNVRPHESLGGVSLIQYILNRSFSVKTQK